MFYYLGVLEKGLICITISLVGEPTQKFHACLDVKKLCDKVYANASCSVNTTSNQRNAPCRHNPQCTIENLGPRPWDIFSGSVSGRPTLLGMHC